MGGQASSEVSGEVRPDRGYLGAEGLEQAQRDSERGSRSRWARRSSSRTTVVSRATSRSFRRGRPRAGIISRANGLERRIRHGEKNSSANGGLRLGLIVLGRPTVIVLPRPPVPADVRQLGTPGIAARDASERRPPVAGHRRPPLPQANTPSSAFRHGGAPANLSTNLGRARESAGGSPGDGSTGDAPESSVSSEATAQIIRTDATKIERPAKTFE